MVALFPKHFSSAHVSDIFVTIRIALILFVLICRAYQMSFKMG